MLHQPAQNVFRPALRVASRPAVSAVGLGYVGAVSAACLAGLGQRSGRVDVDAVKVRPVFDTHVTFISVGTPKHHS